MLKNKAFPMRSDALIRLEDALSVLTSKAQGCVSHKNYRSPKLNPT